MEDCLFCKIIKGEIPSYKIYEDECAYAFLDIAGDFYGHTIVVPKIHCENLLDVNADVLNAVMKAVKRISKHYVDDCGFSGVNVFNNSGKSAEQSIMHLHFHIVPRKEDGAVSSIYSVPEKQYFDFQNIAERLAVKSID